MNSIVKEHQEKHYDMDISMPCRFCGSTVTSSLVDLGMSPLCEEYVTADKYNHVEHFFPLHALVCDKCFLVQVDDYVTPDEIYSEYAYFSSYSDSWIEHGRRYTEAICETAKISKDSFVMELASNDGYLLQHFVSKGIPVLGIEPAANVAKAAEARGIPTVNKFFGVQTAKQLVQQHPKPDLLIGNNVLAHVPDLNDFVAGMKILLNSDGRITMEFPHLVKLMEQNQYDTIYHEHFSYFSLSTVEKVFSHHGLQLFDVEEIPTHGGSIRIHVRHDDDNSGRVSDAVSRLLDQENAFGINDIETYRNFGRQVEESKRDLLEFLIKAKRDGKVAAGYGAPGKGNTLLNYCGIRRDFLEYTVDRNEYKHGCYTPGTRIPIFPTEKIRETKPDFLLVLPWNLIDEIVEQTSYIREWGGKWVVPIPSVAVID